METKVCKTCNIEKGLMEFRNRNSCKLCENKRRYQLKIKQKKNPEYLEKYRREDAMRKKKQREERMDDKTKFIESIRALIRKSIKKRNYTKNSKTFEILGIDNEGFIKHIESNFSEGMNWSNHNLHGWHVDHIIPVSSAKNHEEVIKLNHYTNLRPLWCMENWKKWNKVENIPST